MIDIPLTKKNYSFSLVLFLAILFPLTLIVFASLASPAHADGGILYVGVGGNCGGATPCYATIQDAIDAAAGGDTLKVAQGTYTSEALQVVYIDKGLTIIGGFDISDWAISSPVARPTVIDAGNFTGRRGVYSTNRWC